MGHIKVWQFKEWVIIWEDSIGNRMKCKHLVAENLSNEFFGQEILCQIEEQ